MHRQHNTGYGHDDNGHNSYKNSRNNFDLRDSHRSNKSHRDHHRHDHSTSSNSRDSRLTSGDSGFSRNPSSSSWADNNANSDSSFDRKPIISSLNKPRALDPWELKAAEFRKKIQGCVPYLEKLLKSFYDKGRERALKDEVSDIKYYITLAKDVKYDSQSADCLEDAFQKVIEMARKYPISKDDVSDVDMSHSDTDYSDEDLAASSLSNKKIKDVKIQVGAQNSEGDQSEQNIKNLDTSTKTKINSESKSHSDFHADADEETKREKCELLPNPFSSVKQEAPARRSRLHSSDSDFSDADVEKDAWATSSLAQRKTKSKMKTGALPRMKKEEATKCNSNSVSINTSMPFGRGAGRGRGRDVRPFNTNASPGSGSDDGILGPWISRDINRPSRINAGRAWDAMDREEEKEARRSLNRRYEENSRSSWSRSRSPSPFSDGGNNEVDNYKGAKSQGPKTAEDDTTKVSKGNTFDYRHGQGVEPMDDGSLPAATLNLNPGQGQSSKYDQTQSEDSRAVKFDYGHGHSNMEFHDKYGYPNPLAEVHLKKPTQQIQVPSASMPMDFQPSFQQSQNFLPNPLCSVPTANPSMMTLGGPGQVPSHCNVTPQQYLQIPQPPVMQPQFAPTMPANQMQVQFQQPHLPAMQPQIANGVQMQQRTTMQPPTQNYMHFAGSPPFVGPGQGSYSPSPVMTPMTFEPQNQTHALPEVPADPRTRPALLALPAPATSIATNNTATEPDLWKERVQSYFAPRPPRPRVPPPFQPYQHRRPSYLNQNSFNPNRPMRPRFMGSGPPHNNPNRYPLGSGPGLRFRRENPNFHDRVQHANRTLRNIDTEPADGTISEANVEDNSNPMPPSPERPDERASKTPPEDPHVNKKGRSATAPSNSRIKELMMSRIQACMKDREDDARSSVSSASASTLKQLRNDLSKTGFYTLGHGGPRTKKIYEEAPLPPLASSGSGSTKDRVVTSENENSMEPPEPDHETPSPKSKGKNPAGKSNKNSVDSEKTLKTPKKKAPPKVKLPFGAAAKKSASGKSAAKLTPRKKRRVIESSDDESLNSNSVSKNVQETEEEEDELPIPEEVTTILRGFLLAPDMNVSLDEVNRILSDPKSVREMYQLFVNEIRKMEAQGVPKQVTKEGTSVDTDSNSEASSIVNTGRRAVSPNRCEDDQDSDVGWGRKLRSGSKKNTPTKKVNMNPVVVLNTLKSIQMQLLDQKTTISATTSTSTSKKRKLTSTQSKKSPSKQPGNKRGKKSVAVSAMVAAAAATSEFDSDSNAGFPPSDTDSVQSNRKSDRIKGGAGFGLGPGTSGLDGESSQEPEGNISNNVEEGPLPNEPEWDHDQGYNISTLVQPSIPINHGLGKVKIESDYIPPQAVKTEPLDMNEEHGSTSPAI